jgi:hypothetical protein
MRANHMSTDGLSSGIPVGGPGTGRMQGRTGSRWNVLLKREAWTPLAIDAAAILLAALDVWLVIPEKAEPYLIYLSAFACLALAARRWLPFVVVLGTVPGFLTGWSQLAAMIALGMLATRKQTHWQVWVGAALVWACRFIQWPLPDFASLSWREHVLDSIYGVLVAGMPIAIGLLIGEELRSLVGVLRSGAEDDGPQPGIGELDQLVQGCEVPVHLTVDGVPEQLPAKVSAAPYRTVQECLTNVRKHAPGARRPYSSGAPATS